ncbi:hypothetical protein DPMN_184589 [Dreissena polymorpha]|uniref:Uncharacterized protein n=1 Tax=Dreissena polymorpha TaxID=45954 RepID=A0A9D4DJF5_DREPO|nr:hypothetical protein DPMN_184589 [Dreissena polymorpha]
MGNYMCYSSPSGSHVGSLVRHLELLCHMRIRDPTEGEVGMQLIDAPQSIIFQSNPQ